MVQLAKGSRLRWAQLVILLAVRSLALAEMAKDKPIWTVDLNVYGDEHIETNTLGNPFDKQTGMFFSDTGTLVAYFTKRAPVPGLSIRDQAGQFTLRGVFLDGLTGARQDVHDWPADISGTTLLPARGGKLVFGAANKVELYAPDLTLVKAIDLPRQGKYDEQFIKVSPDGSVLWLVRDAFKAGQPVSAITRFDSESLTPLSSFQGSALGPTFSVANESMAKTYPKVGTSIVISEDGTQWRTLLKAKDVWCVGDPIFANNSQLLVAGCSHVDLLSTHGEVLLDEKYDRAWHVETDAVVSGNGNFAAVSVMKTKGGAFDTAVRRSTTRIIVYDLIRKLRIFELDVSPLPQFVYHFALSRDGDLLAVMVDSSIQVYKLPAR